MRAAACLLVTAVWHGDLTVARSAPYGSTMAGAAGSRVKGLVYTSTLDVVVPLAGSSPQVSLTEIFAAALDIRSRGRAGPYHDTSAEIEVRQ